MLIIGAGGLVLQLLDDLKTDFAPLLHCWSELPIKSALLQEHTKWLCSDEQVLEHFEKNGKECLIAVGGGENRKRLTHKFAALNGCFASFVSPQAFVSKYSNLEETLVLAGARIEAEVALKRGCLINVNAFLAHGCVVGSFVEIAPGALLLGNVQVGDNTFIGAGAVILPNIKVGSNVVVAAGSIVTKEVPDNVLVAGNPSQIKRTI